MLKDAFTPPRLSYIYMAMIWIKGDKNYRKGNARKGQEMNGRKIIYSTMRENEREKYLDHRKGLRNDPYLGVSLISL